MRNDANIKPEWHAIMLDVTPHYNVDEADKPYIESIFDVFVYDRNEHTYLCEMTPSHYLKYTYTFVAFKGDPSEDVRDHIDQAYCYEQTDDSYLHAGDVAVIAAGHPERDKLIEMRDPDATIDDVVEACQADWPL